MAFSIDPSVLEQAASGDPLALATLISELQPHVEKQLMRYPVAEEDRRDLLQATLMQITRRIGSFRGDSSFSTWLFRVTANEALMLMRSQRRHRARLTEGLDLDDLGGIAAANDAEQAPRADDVAADSQRAGWVKEALRELPQEYRDVVVAHYHMDLGLQEIADRFDMTESAVRSRLHRARSRLRSLLDRTPVGRDVHAAGTAAA